MAEPTDQWLSVRDAASALGMSEDAVRSKIKRRTMRSRKGNDGRVLVLVGDRPIAQWSPNGRPLGDQPIDRPSGATPEPRQNPQDALKLMLVSLHRETVGALQATHDAALAVLQEQLDQLRADINRQQARTDAEVERLVGQVHAERSFWVERADRAEVVAEQAMAQVTELSKRLGDLAEQATRPWWSRFFGQSKRSDIGG